MSCNNLQKDRIRISFGIYRQKCEEYVWEWTLRMWANGGRNIKLEQAEFNEMGPQSRDSEFSVIA